MEVELPPSRARVMPIGASVSRQIRILPEMSFYKLSSTQPLGLDWERPFPITHLLAADRATPARG